MPLESGDLLGNGNVTTHLLGHDKIPPFRLTVNASTAFDIAVLVIIGRALYCFLIRTTV
jgi:hypothetical protein